jgi:hypothetical protein
MNLKLKAVSILSMVMTFIVYNEIAQCQPENTQKYPFRGAKTVNKLPQLPHHAKLETAISNLFYISQTKDLKSVQDYTRQHNIKLRGDRILIEATLKDERLAEDITELMLKPFAVEVDSRSEQFICLWVPIDKLLSFSESIDFISLLHRPNELQPYVMSEGFELIGADLFHDEEIRGEGVKIGIIDIGFNGLAEAQENAELPQQVNVVNFTDEDIEEGEIHGVGCAEIIYDLAPEAEYYLAKTFNSADFSNALSYMVDEGINIVSHSCGFSLTSSYYNGIDIISGRVNWVNAQGILFINAAGNYAQRHYRAEFDDMEQEDNYHRYAQDINVNHFVSSDGEFLNFEADDRISISLAWDDYEEEEQNYDLYLVHWDVDNEEWEVAAESVIEQNGDVYPIESISFTVEEEGFYGVSVHNNESENGIDFTLFTNKNLAYRTPEGSLCIPAIAETALAVGAVHDTVWTADEVVIEDFSSQGPTYYGMLKPELCGPDGVSTLTYGDNVFRGTSASCPHVTGAAALLLCQDNELSNRHLRDLLLATAIDAGEEGPDNVFGFGKINLQFERPEARVLIVPEEYETIQEAINVAFYRDTVLVQPGRYIENIDFFGKDIVLASFFLTTGDTSFIESTIIDGDQNGTVVLIRDGVTRKAVLTGFTITNGSGMPFRGFGGNTYGGGIFCRFANPTISYCTIIENTTLGDRGEGGGLFTDFSDIILSHVKVVSNHANEGGGISFDNSNPVCRNVTVAQNISTNNGGGIHTSSGELIFENCEISGNEAERNGGGLDFDRSDAVLRNVVIKNNTIGDRHSGGGVYIRGHSVSIDRSLIYNNHADEGHGGIYVRSEGELYLTNSTVVGNGRYGLYCWTESHVELVNNIFWGNENRQIYRRWHEGRSNVNISFCDIEDGQEGIYVVGRALHWGEGNIQDDPLFIRPDREDFHLTERSRCINAGDPNMQEDPDGTRSDIGFYYFHQENENRRLNMALVEGWNMISINIQPQENLWIEGAGPDIRLMTERLRNNEERHIIILMKDGNGRFYVPEFNFNNIPYWDLAQGYQVKVNQGTEVYWAGESIPADTDIPLSESWNLIAYLPTYELDASAPDFYALSPIIDQVLIAKDGVGNFMLPGFDFSNMPPWAETRGYQVKVTENVDFNYPPEQEEDRLHGSVVKCPHLTEDRHSNCQVRTPDYTLRLPHFLRNDVTSSNMSILVTNLPEEGEIGAFATSGICVGATAFSNQDMIGLAVWGDDESTDEVDGLKEGEAFKLKLWSSSQDVEFDLEPESIIAGSGLIYETNGVTYFAAQALPLIPNQYYLLQNYPNPFNSTTILPYSLPETARLSISIYDISGRLVTNLVEGEVGLVFILRSGMHLWLPPVSIL